MPLDLVEVEAVEHVVIVLVVSVDVVRDELVVEVLEEVAEGRTKASRFPVTDVPMVVSNIMPFTIDGDPHSQYHVIPPPLESFLFQRTFPLVASRA